MNKNNILLMSQYFPIIVNNNIKITGGIERYSFDLASQLSKNNFNVQVITPSNDFVKYDQIENIAISRYNISSIKMIRLLQEDLYSFIYTLIFGIKKDPSIIHAIGGGYHFSLGILLASHILRKPCFFTVCMAPEYNFNNKYHIISIVDRIIAYIFLRKFSKIIIPSIGTAKIIKKDCPYSKIIILPHWVEHNINKNYDIDIKKIRKKYSLNEGPILLYVGRISPEKNVDLLISVFHEILKKFKEINLLIVGGPIFDSNLYYKKIERKIVEFHINNIKFTNFIDTTELIDIYSISDLLILLSEHENAPYAIIEALKFGIPVILSDIDNFKDIISNGCEGYFLNKDAKIISEKILYLLNNRELLEIMRKNAVIRSKLYDPDKIFPFYLHMYNNLT